LKGEEIVYLAAVLAVLLATAMADMPAGYDTAMNKMNTLNVLCVKNYQAGVAFTESYTDFEHLDKDTTVVSRNPSSQDQYGTNESALDATINSNVIGRAILTWRSQDPIPNTFGRHNLLGSNAEELTGVFSINKQIQLWSNSSIAGGNIEWLPCL
jgi:hypothetical protein